MSSPGEAVFHLSCVGPADVGDIQSRLLDHRPVINAEIRYFVKEFEVQMLHNVLFTRCAVAFFIILSLSFDDNVLDFWVLGSFGLAAYPTTNVYFSRKLATIQVLSLSCQY